MNTKETLKETIRLFNIASEAYKQAQSLLLKIDTRIHNEYQYFARAFNSVVSNILLNEGNIKYDEIQSVVNDAHSAAKHLLNDSLDLLHIYALKESKSLNRMCNYKSIADVYIDYIEVTRILKKFTVAISTSRSERGTARINKYVEMVKSEDYRKLINYCNDLDEIKSLLKKKKSEEQQTQKVFYYGSAFSFVALATTYIFNHF